MVQFQHVKGHQDKGYPTVLQQDAWLNIKADLLAKASIVKEKKEQEIHPLPFEPWVLTISNRRIVKNHKWEIRWVLNGPVAN